MQRPRKTGFLCAKLGLGSRNEGRSAGLDAWAFSAQVSRSAAVALPARPFFKFRASQTLNARPLRSEKEGPVEMNAKAKMKRP